MLTLNLKGRKMELSQIRELVESEFKIDISQVTRIREVVYVRNLYYKLARDYTSFGYSDIGKEINKNHATVIHGVKTMEEVVLIHDSKFIKAYSKISRKDLINKGYQMTPRNILSLIVTTERSIKNWYSNTGS